MLFGNLAILILNVVYAPLNVSNVINVSHALPLD